MGAFNPDEATRKFYEELCSNLNMDQETADEAWTNYETNCTRYTLEGNQQHWLACALYVACRKTRVNAVNQLDMVEGNCVPLMQLLRKCNISLVQFLEKAKKWCDMTGLGAEFRDRLTNTERNYAVSMVIFKKFRPIFLDMFQRPTGDNRGQNARSRKPRNTPCTPSQLFDFTWILFISAKSRIPDILDDLVNSYHLLLVCCNMVFGNALLADRRDLLNPQFMGLPSNFHDEGYVPPHEAPCILAELIHSHDGILLEAQAIREYWWNNLIDNLFDKNILKGEATNRSGLLEPPAFENNMKAVDKEYEEFVLNRGDFDERTFLGPEADSEIGSPTKMADFSEKMQARKDVPGYLTFSRETPLTGQYLSRLEPGPRVSPVSTAVESVSKLQAMLSGRQAGPSVALQHILQSCKDNLQEAIEQRVEELGELFISRYTQQHGEIPGSHVEFAHRRLQLGVTLYYMLLEITTIDEQQKRGNNGIPALLENALCQKSLFACCLEVVLFCYNSQRKFPWILEALELEPYYFYKVIEVMVIATYDKLSRGTIKNLQFIEEQILESMVWQKDSPLWEEIDNLKKPLPSYEEVKLPDDEGNVGQTLLSPSGRNMHTAVRRLLGQDKVQIRTVTTPSGQQLLLSPQNAKKRLFLDQSGGGTAKAGQSLLQTSSGRVAINIQTIQGGDGQRYIPISYVQSGGSVIIQGQPTTPTNDDTKKPRMTGSLALFLRKFYFLASVRLQALCKMLYLQDLEVQKIWTNLEYSITHKAQSLLMDRHLDQLIMCAIYVVCKVTHQNREFKVIMHHYRDLPQSASHVYRDVLLSTGGVNPDELVEKKRGDLIEFYNTVYVIHMRDFSVTLAKNSNNESLKLSPLPTPKSQPMSPKVRVAENCNLFISALGKNALQDSPVHNTVAYYFSRSPVETLRQINNMVNSNPASPRVGKRILQSDSEEIIIGIEGPSPKKSCVPVVTRKIQNLIEDRLNKSQE